MVVVRSGKQVKFVCRLKSRAGIVEIRVQVLPYSPSIFFKLFGFFIVFIQLTFKFYATIQYIQSTKQNVSIASSTAYLVIFLGNI